MIPALAASRAPILGALRAHPLAARQPVHPALAVACPLLLAGGVLCFLSDSGGVVAAGVAVFLAGLLAGLPVLAPAVAAALGRTLSPLVRGAPGAAAELRRTRNRTALTAAGLSLGVAAAVAVSALTAGSLTARPRRTVPGSMARTRALKPSRSR